MSASDYIKISQLDKTTVNDLKSHTGIFELPVISTDGKTVDLIRSEIGRTTISSGLGDNYIIDIHFKQNENITFSFSDLGLYWPNNKTFETLYTAITINDSPSEIYELSLIDGDSPEFKLITCDWQLENSQYKKIINKVSICLLQITKVMVDAKEESIINSNGIFENIKISPSASFLSNTDLIILGNVYIKQLIINENVNIDVNLITKKSFGIVTPIGNLPSIYTASQVNFTNNFNSKTYFEGRQIKTILNDRTAKINNGKFVNSVVSPKTLDNIFENYETLDTDYLNF